MAVCAGLGGAWVELGLEDRGLRLVSGDFKFCRSVFGWTAILVATVALAVWTTIAVAGTLTNFKIENFECVPDGWVEGVTSTWDADGSLIVELRTWKTSVDRVKEGSGYYEVLGNAIYLGYETFNPLEGDAAPACLFPVKLTYRLSDLPRKSYRYYHPGNPMPMSSWKKLVLFAFLVAVGWWVVARYLRIIREE